jgi:hypothetical protein
MRAGGPADNDAASSRQLDHRPIARKETRRMRHAASWFVVADI